MKIAHESPLFLLEESKSFNDYDYALAPLFAMETTSGDRDSTYYDFFVEALKNGREVIVDNGNEDPLDYVEYVGFIRKLVKDSKLENENKISWMLPTIYNDCDNTTRAVKEFLKRFKKIPGRAIGVIQGNNFVELYKSYHDLYPFTNKIGIPYNSKAYEVYFEMMQAPLPTTDKWLHGRQLLMEDLFHAGWLTTDKMLHLCDAAYPDEFAYYTHHHAELGNFIETINTADPVIQGILNKEYDGATGSRVKPPARLVELLQNRNPDPRIRIIRQNIKLFRSINHLQPARGAPAVAGNVLNNFLIPADGRRR